MSRFNAKVAKPKVFTPEGGQATKRGAKSDLFFLAVSFMGGDSNFYESSDDRYNRLKQLVTEVAATDPKWLIEFIRWVRNTAMMRTVAGVMAIEAVMGRLRTVQAIGERAATTQGQHNRHLIDAACARADEPGELLAYYLANYSKPIPQPIKNGIGDAVRRLYTERAYLRYGAANNKSLTMKDVLRLTHAQTDDVKQNNLFKYITNPVEGASLALTRIGDRNELMNVPHENRREVLMADPSGYMIRNAEMGWENISAWLGKMDAEAWEAVIPNMGVMALLRNLNNFTKAGISDESMAWVGGKIGLDNEAINQSRILPMRVLSAYRNVENVRWHYPLEMCLEQTLRNIPELPGRTLVLIDMSGSMFWGRLSDRSQLTYADAAKIFGSVLAVRNPGVDLIEYGSSWHQIKVERGSSVLKVMDRFSSMGGTNTAWTLEKAYDNHDRVIIVTDEQAAPHQGKVGGSLPPGIPLYTWNLAGYEYSHDARRNNHYTFGGGFSDAAFGMIKYIEDGSRAKWPWENG